MELIPVSGSLGAEVRGVNLRQLSPDEHAQVVDALHAFEVIFFRRANLTAAEHMGVAGALGEINLYPASQVMGASEPTFQVITDGPDSPPQADNWHTDVTWSPTPPKYAVLQAEIVAQRGGDTLWASTTTAHDALSPTMRRMITGLEIVHDNEAFLAGVQKKAPADVAAALIPKLREAFPPVNHPLVRTNPDTGRRALYLSSRLMGRIEGMEHDESQAILDFLHRYIENPRFQCRWHWEAGDVAIWDERSTVHRSAADHFPQVRSMRRVEVVGERPFFSASRDSPVLDGLPGSPIPAMPG